MVILTLIRTHAVYIVLIITNVVTDDFTFSTNGLVTFDYNMIQRKKLSYLMYLRLSSRSQSLSRTLATIIFNIRKMRR